MLKIQLADGYLDTKQDEVVEISWVTTRFSTSIRDPYTNDFSIPKTWNNIRLLQASGLIDSNVQMLGAAFAPATMTIGNGVPKAIKIQVVSVTPTDINICCYENIIPSDFMNSNLTDWFTDGYSTIWEWDRNSRNRYPNVFREYSYGMRYNSSYAQLHPCMKLLDIVNDLSQVSGYNLPVTQNHFPIDYYMVATKKTVCPQNTRQMIEGVKAHLDGETTEEGKTLKIIASQHVTNDAQGYKSESTDMELTYNRYAYVSARIYISWMVPSSYGTYTLSMLKNGSVYRTFNIVIPHSDDTSGVVTDTFVYEANEGDVISFKITGLDVFNKLNILMDCFVTGYEVYESDYDQELVYCPRPAKLTLYQYYSTQGIFEITCYADGNTYTYTDDKFGTRTASQTIPYRSLSYFGYWCNVPKFKVKDMIFSIGWFSGSKVVIVNDNYEYTTATKKKAITGQITQLDPANSYFGQTSYVGYNGDLNPTTYTFDNVWLEKEKWLHKSVFGYVRGKKRADNANAAFTAVLPQYSYSYNDGDIEISFNEIDTPIVCRLAAWSGQSYLAPPRQIPRFGFNNITNIMQATIETTDVDLDWCDYVYLDGREYMVVSGETNVKDQKSKILAMLVNYLPNDGSHKQQIAIQ